MTAAGISFVKHRKSPGAHTRWSHGRHASPSISTAIVTGPAGRHGADRAESVGP
jgi:hypothetical protein